MRSAGMLARDIAFEAVVDTGMAEDARRIAQNRKAG
jgi:hypothetical protein